MNKGHLVLPPDKFGGRLWSGIKTVTPSFHIEHGRYVLCYSDSTLKVEWVAQSGLPRELCVVQATIHDGNQAIKLGAMEGRELGFRCRVPVAELGPEVAKKLLYDVALCGQMAA